MSKFRSLCPSQQECVPTGLRASRPPLKENEVYIYSDFGAEQAEDIETVAGMIDSVTE